MLRKHLLAMAMSTLCAMTTVSAIGQAIAADAPATKADAATLARGKYFTKIAGCNDCHTPGYMAAGGDVDEKLWLTGDSFGWRGPWGTTYAPNLRLYMAKLSEAQWLDAARSMKARPPMPWFNLREVSDNDLRAFYVYVRSLGPGGKPAPAYLPPDKEPPQPYAQFPSPPPAKK